MRDNLYIWGDLAVAPQPSAQAFKAQRRSSSRNLEATAEPGSDAGATGSNAAAPPGLTTATAAASGGGGGGGLCAPAGRWAAVSLGDRHAAGITCRGELYTWGCNRRGQTGRSDSDTNADADNHNAPTIARAHRNSRRSLYTPRLLRLPSGVRVRAVACGGEHTLALTDAAGVAAAGVAGISGGAAAATSSVFAWGCNRFGQCGLGAAAPGTIWRPMPVTTLAGVPVCQLAAGRSHSLALTGAAHVMSWGCNGSGQLGHGDRISRVMPTQLEGLWALPVTQIAAGDAHSAAVTSSGHAFVWGANHYGQLGLLPEPWLEQPAAAATAATEPPPAVGGHGGFAATLPKAAAAAAASPGPSTSGSRSVYTTPAHAFEDDSGPRRHNGCRPLRVEPRGQQQQQRAQQQRRDRCGPGSPAALASPRTPRSPFTPGTPRSPAALRRAAMRRSGGSGRTNPQFLLAMVEMGIPPRHARIALDETGNAGVEVATEWLFATDRTVLLEEPSSDDDDEANAASGAGGSIAHVTPPTQGRSDMALEACAGQDAAGRSGEVVVNGGALGGRNALQGARRGGGGDDGGEGCSAGSGGGGGWAIGDYFWPQDDLVVLEPRRVPLKGVRQLAAGARHTVAVTDGGVYAWGEGAAGALGLGDCEDRDMPCKVELFLGALPPPHDRDAAAAASTAAAKTSPRRSQSPAGLRTPSHAYVRSRLGAAAKATATSTPTAAGAAAAGSSCCPSNIVIHRVACGSQHTLFLANDGAVYWSGTMPAVAGGGAAGAARGGGAAGGGSMAGPSTSGAGGGRSGQVWSAASGPRVLFSSLPRRLELDLHPQPHPQPPACAAETGAKRADGAACVDGGAGGGGGRAEQPRSSPVVYDVVTRGSSSALLMCGHQELPQLPAACSPPALLEQLRTAIECAAAARAAGVEVSTLSAALKAVTAGVQTVLGSPAAISAAFGRRGRMGLDGQLLEDVLGSVKQLFAPRPGEDAAASSGGGGGVAVTVVELHRYSLVAAMQAAATALVEDLAAHTRLLGTPERAQVLLAALQHPLLSEPGTARQLLPRLAATVMGAPPVVRTWLVRWWADYPGPLLESRVVAPMQAYLTRELGATKRLTTSVMNVIKVLARVEEAASLSNSLPPEAFYNALISDKLDVQDHYTAWRQAQELGAVREAPREAPFSFCSYPFLLNARAKSHLLHLEARFQMEQSVAHARMEVQLYGGSAASRRRAEEGPVIVKSHSSAGGSGSGVSGGGTSSGRGGGGSVSAWALVGSNLRRRRRSSVSPQPGGGGAAAASTSSSGSGGGGGAGRDVAVTPSRGGGGRVNGDGDGSPSDASSYGSPASCTPSASPSPSPASSRGSGGSGGGSGGGSCASSSASSGGSGGGGGGGSGTVSSSLRSLFTLWRRRRSSASGGSRDGADGIGGDARRGGGGQRGGSSRGAALELPRPSECCVPGVHSDMCILRVRRTHLVEDAMEEVGRQARRDLLKPLRVHFIGEEGIDAGGVKKEFFALLMERLLSPDYGLMSYDTDSRTYWFNPGSLEPPESFFLLGLVLGLAVYNRVLLAFPAPLLLYQKLRGGRELGLRDLEGWQPGLARGLRQLLEYDGPEPMADVFGLTFSVDVDRFGAIQTIPLKPGGEHTPVTEDSRAEYVSLLASWHMEGAVAAQFEAFAAGFRLLCEGPALALFNAQELERLVCGNPVLDFAALRDAARYEGGYGRESPVVGWLWDTVLHELSPEDQRAFLKFFTGSDRSPIGGLGSLRPTIQRDGPDSHKLPTAHTCFNTLLLPEYGSRAKLAALLRLAINNSEGFGLQ